MTAQVENGRVECPRPPELMEWSEIREAVPPAYTELIGHQLLSVVNSERRVA